MPPRYSVSRIQSCNQCRQRKAKCNRERPCGSCIKNKLDCKYFSTERPTLIESGYSFNDEMAIPPGIIISDSRLQHQLNNRQATTTSHTENHRGEFLDTFANPSSGAIATYNRAENTVSEASAVAAQNNCQNTQYPSILLGSTSILITLSDLHPPVERIWLIWQIFTENIDPLFKLFHAASLQKKILDAVQNLYAVDPKIECLIFSIYFAAVVSITPEECLEKLKEPKLTLLHRYVYALIP
jgi:hypothetical protein